MSTVIESVEKSCGASRQTLPEIQFYLNDLPGNYFNTLFKHLPNFHRNPKGLPFFVMGAPGSFHGRIFPRNCLHLVHSSYSVHWLSRVSYYNLSLLSRLDLLHPPTVFIFSAPFPAIRLLEREVKEDEKKWQVPQLVTKEGLPLNKGKIHISKTSPPEVEKVYLAQFHDDFTNFLRCQSEEMVIGARLVLVLHGRRSPDPASKESCYIWELLAEGITSLVTEGLVEEEKPDNFNVPFYTASQHEVQNIVQQEGSFTVEHKETITMDAEGISLVEDQDPWTRGKKKGHSRGPSFSTISGRRSWTSSLYGDKLADLLGKDLSKERRQITSIVLVLRKHS